MRPPGEKSGVDNPARINPRDTGSTRSTITPLNPNSEYPSSSEKMFGSSPSSRAGVPIPGRKRSDSSSQANGWEKASLQSDASRIELPVPMGSSPPRSPPNRRLSRRGSETSTTIIGDGSVGSSMPTQGAQSRSPARPSHVRKPSADQIGLGPCPPQPRASPGQRGQAQDGHARERPQRVPGGTWTTQVQGVPGGDSQEMTPVPHKPNAFAGVPSRLTATRPTAKLDTHVSRAFLSPLAQSPIQATESGAESDDNASLISRCVSSLAPSRRGSIAPDVDKVENNLLPLFTSYYKLYSAMCRCDVSRLPKEAKAYLTQLVQAEELVAGSAGSVCYTATYDTALKALAFSRTLMTCYFDTIEARMKEETRDRALATGYQLMEMTMSNFRTVLQTVELEKELAETATVVSEMEISTNATVGHDDAPEPPVAIANKPPYMKKPSLFDRLRKVSLGCLAALDPSLPSTPARASHGPFRHSAITLEDRTVRQSSIYTPSLASEALGWDHMFLSAVTDGSPQSLTVRASLALFPDDRTDRPDLPPVVLESDVDRGKDGNVVRATVRGLIRLFTEPTEMVKNDMADLIDAFFLFAPTFTTAQNLFELLLEREQQQPPRELTELESVAWNVRHECTRIYVANLICLWLGSHWDKSLDKRVEGGLLDRIGVLSSRFAADQSIPVELAHQLIDSIRYRGSWADKEKERTEASVANDVYSEPLFRTSLDQIVASLTRPDDWSKLDITYFHSDGGPEMIARQLTAIETELFHSFEPRELIKFEDRDLQRKLREWKSFSEALSLWVTKSIVQHKDVTHRVQAATVFITVAGLCKSLRNYSSALAIILGLNTSSVSRLRLTEDSISHCFKEVRTGLDQFFHARSNYGEYRAELPVNLPTVPLEVVILRDIKVSREVLPRVKSTAQPPASPTEEMIPLQYYRNMRRTIRDLEKCRGEYTTIQKVGVIYDWIHYTVDELKTKDYDTYSKELTQMSLDVEPKTNNQGPTRL